MSPASKIRCVSRNLERLIEELPLFLLRLEEVTGALDKKLKWREFKFCFKIGMSKVSGYLQRLVAHRDTFADVMMQICDLIQRDAFTQSLYALDLLDATKVAAHAEDCPRLGNAASSSTPKQQYSGYKVS